jgi:hypothetical protein
MAEPQVEPTVRANGADRQSEAASNAELEELATGVELTLASVLQGIAIAVLIPKIVDLIAAGEVAKLPYIPASLLLIFIIWVAFIGHSLSFKTWPIDLSHNMLYFLIVTSEMVLLTFLDQPAEWYLSLIGFGLITGASYWYNARLLRRQSGLYITAADHALYDDMANDQAISLRFMAGYCLVGLLGFGALQAQPDLGLSQELGWAVTGLSAMVLPLIHVLWQARMMARRADLIERARAGVTG